MICVPGMVSAIPRAIGPVFFFFRTGTIFRRYQGRRVPFLCFTLPYTLSAVPRVSGPVFMFCAPGVVSRGTEGVGSHFHVLCSQTRFGRYRGRRVQFSCFARPNTFSEVPRASGPVFLFFAPGHDFGSPECVGSRFHVMRARNGFGSPEGDESIFMFCAPGHVFGGTDGVGSRFHVLHAWTRDRRYRGCRVPFSCFALPDLFPAVPRVLGHIFMFCAPRLVFGGTEGVESCFLVLRSRIRFRRFRGRQVHFHVVRYRTCFRLCRVRRVPFSSFVRSYLFFGGRGGDGSRFYVLRDGTSFWRYQGHRVRFHVLLSRTHFRRKRGCRIPFSCFAHPDTFSTVRRASGLIFMFCAPGLIFDGNEGVGSGFQDLRCQTRFRRYRGRRVPFSCFARWTRFRRYRGRRVPFSCFARP
jgi:hypothetical protein